MVADLPGGLDSIRSISIKSSTSPALPVFVNDKMAAEPEPVDLNGCPRGTKLPKAMLAQLATYGRLGSSPQLTLRRQRQAS